MTLYVYTDIIIDMAYHYFFCITRGDVFFTCTRKYLLHDVYIFRFIVGKNKQSIIKMFSEIWIIYDNPNFDWREHFTYLRVVKHLPMYFYLLMCQIFFIWKKTINYTKCFQRFYNNPNFGWTFTYFVIRKRII